MRFAAASGSMMPCERTDGFTADILLASCTTFVPPSLLSLSLSHHLCYLFCCLLDRSICFFFSPPQLLLLLQCTLPHPTFLKPPKYKTPRFFIASSCFHPTRPSKTKLTHSSSHRAFSTTSKTSNNTPSKHHPMTTTRTRLPHFRHTNHPRAISKIHDNKQTRPKKKNLNP